MERVSGEERTGDITLRSGGARKRATVHQTGAAPKRHRDTRFVGHEWEEEKPISIILTTVAALAYQGETSVLEALEGIATRLEGYETSQVIGRDGDRWRIPNPVNPAENFADHWNEPGSHRAEAFFEWLRWLHQDVALLGEAEGVDEARDHLHESFSARASAAPPPTGARVAVAQQVPALADTSHCQRPPWPLRLTGRVRVRGSVRAQRYATKEIWPLSGRPIPKKKWIRFSATTNLRAPYEVKWQVVNTGEEAKAAGVGQLRGGFDDGTGDFGATQWEHTEYRGTHWIEAFVIKDGVCVARSGPVQVRVR